MISLYDIVFKYIEKFYQIEPVSKVKSDIIYKFEYILDSGWTSEEIMYKLDRCNANNGVPNLSELFERKSNEQNRNLMNSKTFYYHNLLRVCPPPPTQVWDINTGDIQTVSEDFYLEMRASITPSQITDYYVEQMKLDTNKININRYIGSINYMINKYGLDLVLFTIDVAANYTLSDDLQKPNSPVGIVEYMYKAQDLLNQKLSETKAAGDDKIVYRKRVLTFRSWSEEEKPTQGLLYQEYINYS